MKISIQVQVTENSAFQFNIEIISIVPFLSKTTSSAPLLSNALYLLFQTMQ